MSSTKKADQDLVKDCLRHIWEAPDCDNPEEHLKKSLALCARMSIAGAGALVPIHENPVFLLRVFNTSRATEPGEKVKAVHISDEVESFLFHDGGRMADAIGLVTV